MRKPIIWQTFCRKLHENEEIGPRGLATLHHPLPPGSAAANVRKVGFAEVFSNMKRGGAKQLPNFNLCIYFCRRRLNGFDFENPEERVLRSGNYKTKVPAVRGKVGNKQTDKQRQDRLRQCITSRHWNTRQTDIIIHLPGRALTSNCFVNSFKMVFCGNIF